MVDNRDTSMVMMVKGDHHFVWLLPETEEHVFAAINSIGACVKNPQLDFDYNDGMKMLKSMTEIPVQQNKSN
jgi:hypothetical protein